MISVFHDHLAECIPKFRTKVKLQFQQQSKIVEINFFDLYQIFLWLLFRPKNFFLTFFIYNVSIRLAKPNLYLFA